MRVLIADDQPSVRSALRLLLEQNGMSVVGDVTSGAGLVEWLAVNRADLVLLDWELPGQSCGEVIQVLRSLYPYLSVIVLNSRPQTREAALAAGADGFVCKGDPPEYLLKAICSRRTDIGSLVSEHNPEKEIMDRRKK